MADADVQQEDEAAGFASSQRACDGRHKATKTGMVLARAQLSTTQTGVVAAQEWQSALLGKGKYGDGDVGWVEKVVMLHGVVLVRHGGCNSQSALAAGWWW